MKEVEDVIFKCFRRCYEKASHFQIPSRDARLKDARRSLQFRCVDACLEECAEEEEK